MYIDKIAIFCYNTKVSIENKNFSSSPENIQSEEMLLLEIQAGHQRQLEELGIADKARRVCGLDSVEDYNNSLIRMSVAYPSKLKDKGGTVVELPSVRFAIPHISKSGHISTSFKYAKVAEVYEGMVYPNGEFTEEDTAAVLDMLAGLKQAKDSDVLRHLSSDLANINDPNAAIMRLPKVEERHKA